MNTRFRRTCARAGGLAFALLLLTGCGSGNSDRTTLPSVAATGSGGTGAEPGFDPPAAFGRTGVPLPREAGAGAVTTAGAITAPLPIALHGADAYIASPRNLQIVDTRTGASLGVIAPQGTVLTGTGTAAATVPTPAPAMVTVGQSTLTLVLAPFLVDMAGKAAIELIAVDTATRHPVWSARIGDLPDWASQPSATAPAVRVVGVSKHTAVLEVTAGGEVGDALGIDLTTHKARWQNDGFEAGAVGADTVVGALALDAKDPTTVERSIVGLGLDDGGQRWKNTDVKDAMGVRVVSAGPGQAVVLGSDYTDGSGFALLVATADGTGVALPNAADTATGCAYDGLSTLACWGQQRTAHRLYGVDALTGATLWRLSGGGPGAGDTVPVVTAAHRGAVYGTGPAGHGPVVLDARTGRVRAAAPGLAPVLLDGTVGIAAATDQGGKPGSDHTVAAYPATG